MCVLVIDDKSEHLETVKVLWRASSDTLGFLPDGAFTDYASQRRILAVLDSAGDCVGYLLYRVAKGRATVAHLCIAETARGQGHAAALVRHLVTITGNLRGIALRCRRDFPAYSIWPKLGFAAVNEAPGRAADGSELTLFWLDHNHPDLFTQEATVGLDAVIDSNVLVDLAESRREESQGLLADWLQDSIRLCVTPEHCNDFDRSSDGALRQKRRQQAANFHQLASSPADYGSARRLLLPLFPNRATPQDESDFRHLARALAGAAGAFITRDEPMLSRADDVYTACGLPIVRPAELIGRIDELLREREYQRFQVAGTNRIFRQRASSADGALIGAIKAPDERRRHLQAIVQPFLADPQRFACVAVRDRDERVLAFYVLERQQQFDRVPLFRICSHRLAGTLARSILTGLAHQAAQDGHAGVLVADSRLTDDVRMACTDLGFLPVRDGRLKLVVSGVHPASDLADKLDQLGTDDPAIGRLVRVLRSPLDTATASQMEHLLWPAKIADAHVPSFIVSIRPEFAQHLFDEDLAKQGLFGADVDLALNPESVYYRSASQRLPAFPGRILWYVSQNRKFEGAQSIRACSRIAEVCIGQPKPLFKRFQRLGVYEWSNLLDTAKGDCERDILAVRFHDTERLHPVAWDAFQGILREHGVRTNLESPAQIPATVFNEIYALALNSSTLR
ncbi:MAG: PIN domain-containing protein [Pirellulales bacterium]|nr:PIN domain-containing protein [Pirellulales bacterium]